MNISTTSWHYRLWNHLIFDQSGVATSTWFAEGAFGTHIPTALCPYINRLLAYFFIQLPGIVFLGVMATSPLILGPMQWIISGKFLPDTPSSLFEGIVFVIFALYVIAAGILMFLILWEIISRRIRKSVNGQSITPKAFTETVGIASAYYNAVHNKVCPMITFVDDQDSAEKK